MIGMIIALGAGVTFLAIGGLTLFAVSRATHEQILPGFRPDRPNPLERALTLVMVWGPLALVVLLCLLGGLRFLSVAFGAIGA